MPKNLKIGHYRIEEVNAPEGYTINKNYAAVDRGGEYKQLTVDPAWASLEVEGAAANNDPAFINEVVRPIKSVKCWRMFSGGEGICLGRIGAITCSPW